MFRTRFVLFAAFICSLFGSTKAAAQPAGRFAYLTGTIGKTPITVLLHQHGSTVEGHYYYQKTQVPLAFRGQLTGDSLTFVASGPSVDEEFKALWKGGAASGVWINNNRKGQSLPLQLTVDATRSGWFQYVYTTGTTYLFPTKKSDTSPQATYTEGAVWPTAGLPAPLRPVFENAIRRGADLGQAASPQGPLVQRKNEFLKTYRKENARVSPKEVENAPGAYMASHDAHLTFAYLSDQLAVLSSFVYDFTGGAHGNYATTYQTIDLRTGRTLALTDLLSPAGRRKLPALLEKAFRQQFRVRPGESLESAGLFANRITPGTNFYLTATSLVFTYPPYEIGPYALGEISLAVALTNFTAGELTRQPGER